MGTANAVVISTLSILNSAVKCTGAPEAGAYEDRIRTTTVTLRFLIFVAASAAGIAQSSENLFQTRCAGCHSQNNTVGAPLPGTLRQMSWQLILAALETGKMQSIGNGISAVQR